MGIAVLNPTESRIRLILRHALLLDVASESLRVVRPGSVELFGGHIDLTYLYARSSSRDGDATTHCSGTDDTYDSSHIALPLNIFLV